MPFPGSTEIYFITIISPLEQFLVLVPCFVVCGFFGWLVGVGLFVFLILLQLDDTFCFVKHPSQSIHYHSRNK